MLKGCEHRCWILIRPFFIIFSNSNLLHFRRSSRHRCYLSYLFFLFISPISFELHSSISWSRPFFMSIRRRTPFIPLRQVSQKADHRTRPIFAIPSKRIAKHPKNNAVWGADLIMHFCNQPSQHTNRDYLEGSARKYRNPGRFSLHRMHRYTLICLSVAKNYHAIGACVCCAGRGQLHTGIFLETNIIVTS